MNVLVLNCGSSSAKFAVIDPASGDEPLSGIAQRLGTPEAALDWTLRGERRSRPLPGADHEAALRAVVDALAHAGLSDGLGGVGHRVVHGADRFSASTAITPEVLAEIEACVALSPLHNPPNLVGIRLGRALFPKLPQVAVFDTAFHQTMPPRAYVYPVPYAWLEQHRVRRYGFHGTSHRFVAQQAVKQLGLPPEDCALVTAHLGNGCSCAAVRNGASVDTTMGLTPLEGLMMGTRSGSIDPAIVSTMAAALGRSADRIVEALNKASGLLGVSGVSNDLRAVQAAAERGEARAALAIEIFCYVLAKAVAGLVVPLGRIDALIFTGGIGENSALVRSKVIAQLEFLGFSLDPEANAAHGGRTGGRITTSSEPVAAVIPTHEEWMIAIDTAAIAGGG
jgi:acetate kinase